MAEAPAWEKCTALECRCKCHSFEGMVHMMACCLGQCKVCGKFIKYAEGCERFRTSFEAPAQSEEKT